MRTKAQVLT